jgi:uncharacterized protein (TIGR02271 family)
MNTRPDRTSTRQDLTSMIGHHVYDAEGIKIGTAGKIYHSDATGEPEWVTVKTGTFGSKESFVPLNDAQADDKGLHVSARKDTVQGAPRIAEDGHLSATETAELYRHYGLTPSSAAMNSGQAVKGAGAVPAPRTTTNSETAARPAPAAADREAATRPDLGNGQHQSVLRSEEHLRASTETVESGRVRLRKSVVTTQQKITVPIQHEEVRVTREPVKPGEAGTGAKIGEEEHEVILHAERPVVVKEVVPVERVSLGIETVREDREVSETVRREEVEINDDTKRPPR